MAIPLDRPNSAVAKRQLGESPAQLLVHLSGIIRTYLTKKNERLRFAPTPATPKPRVKAGAGNESARTWECWL
jgi:hypothetical protein